MYILSICDKAKDMQVIWIIKDVFKMLCNIIPSIIILVMIVELFNEFKKNFKKAFSYYLPRICRNLIICLIIFLLPNILHFVFGGSTNDTIACFNNASKEKVVEMKEKEAEEQKIKDEETEKRRDEMIEKSKIDRGIEP